MKRLFDLFRRKPEPVKVITGSEPDVDAIGDLILKQLRASGMIPPGTEVKVSHQPVWIDGDGEMHGIKPPADPAVDGWSWDAWSKEMAALAFPGWSPCRFAHRMTRPNGTETARFVFGITQGPFGLWRNNFNVCSYDGEDWNRGPEILTCLTHLPTGMGLGIFATKDAAALAADTAIRTCPQLADVEHSDDDNSPWSIAMTRTSNAWESLGIIPSTNAHAHDINSDSGQQMIMGLAENLEAGRPEKLS